MFRYTEKRLAKDIGRIAESIDSSLRYAYTPDHREVTLSGTEYHERGPYTIYLGNLFLKVEKMPRRERQTAIEAFVGELLLPKEPTPDELMASLAIRVRTDFEMNLRKHQFRVSGHEPPESISIRRGELLVEIVSDRESSVSVTPLDDLRKIDVTAEDTFRMAFAKARRGTDANQWEQIDDSIWYPNLSTYAGRRMSSRRSPHLGPALWH